MIEIVLSLSKKRTGFQLPAFGQTLDYIRSHGLRSDLTLSITPGDELGKIALSSRGVRWVQLKKNLIILFYDIFISSIWGSVSFLQN